MSVRIDDAVSLFLAGKKGQATRKVYRRRIDLWSEHLRERGADLASATSVDVRLWIQHLEEREGEKPRANADHPSTFASQTIIQYVSTIRSLYAFLMEAQAVNHNPVLRDILVALRSDHREKRPTEYVHFEKVKELLDFPSRYTREGIRDRALISVLVGSGLRRGEVLRLTLADVRVSLGGRIYLQLRRTKKKGDVPQAMPPWARDRLMALIEQRKAECARQNDPLFVLYYSYGPGKTALSTTTLSTMVKKWCEQVGIEGDITPHSFRATLVTKCFYDKLPIDQIQRIARHSSPVTTMRYNKRREAVDESPLENLTY